MINPLIIGITGESGVGKSTVADIISIFYGVENTVVLSTDDLHKWERTNSNWNSITHLNPEANNLELGDMHLQDLVDNKFIYRSVYNHITGNFNPPVKIESKAVIINEGLHAYYTEISKKLTSLKIYIDTDESLRVHWKIIRDTEERGYKYNMVLESIANRKADNEVLRANQIDAADVVIKMTPAFPIQRLGDKHEKINIKLSIIYNKEIEYKSLFEYIEEYNKKINNLIKLSENFGNDLEYCQDNGGNISVKISDKYMAIKSSGIKLKEVAADHGYSLINFSSFHKLNEDNYDVALTSKLFSDKYKKASMEAGFHTILDDYTIHLHPVYLTLLLCLENSHDIIGELYWKYDYTYIKYCSPGFELFKNIHAGTKIYFLTNHGVIVTTRDPWYAEFLVKDICNIAKQYVLQKISEEFSLEFANLNKFNYLFPDAVIYPNKLETNAMANYIEIVGSKLGKLRHLTESEIYSLQNMSSENYRKNL